MERCSSACGEATLFELKIDRSDIERKVRAMRGAQDQVPYAMSLVLNKAAENAREVLIREWPLHVRARQSSFIRYALRRGPFATKHNLRIEIYDQTGKRFLTRLDGGGTHAARGGNIAIPVEANVRIGAHGVRKSQLPRNMPNAVILNKNGRPAIYQRIGKGKKSRLKLMYVLRPSVQVPNKMPFGADFTFSVLNDVRTELPKAMARAMSTSRK